MVRFHANKTGLSTRVGYIAVRSKGDILMLIIFVLNLALWSPTIRLFQGSSSVAFLLCLCIIC